MKKFLVLFPVCLFFVSCASPSLRKWEGKKMTLCCPANACPVEKWAETVAKHCPGVAKVIGGETVEKISGFSTQTTNLVGLPRGVVQQQSVRAETSQEECRVYQCSSDVVGF